MTDFALRYHPKVVSEDIPKLDPPTRKRIRAAIERKLTTHPEQFAKPLAYTRSGLWSLRAGPWRVVFTMHQDELWILRIGHRSEVYKELGTRTPPD